MTQMIPAFVDGKLTPMEKLAVHQQGLRHLAISVFIMNGDKILLQRRAMGKYHTPGLWANTCCTHPWWGESAALCAKRRLTEELGITGLELHHAGQTEYRADLDRGLVEHELVDLFVGHAPLSLSLALNPDEVMETTWMSLRDLAQAILVAPENYTPWLRIYLAEGWGNVARMLNRPDPELTATCDAANA